MTQRPGGGGEEGNKNASMNCFLLINNRSLLRKSYQGGFYPSRTMKLHLELHLKWHLELHLELHLEFCWNFDSFL